MKIRDILYKKYQSKLKGNLRKKKTFKGMFFTRLIVVFAVCLLVATGVFYREYNSAGSFLWSTLAQQYEKYVYKMSDSTSDYYKYQEGGKNRLDLPGVSGEEQLVAALGKVPMMVSMIASDMEGYWGIYDFDASRFIEGQREKDALLITVFYRGDDEEIAVNYNIAEEQQELLQLYPEDAGLREIIHINSAYIKGTTMYVEKYVATDGTEKTADLSGIELSGCRYVTCDIAPDDEHNWCLQSNVSYGRDGQYEIAVSGAWKVNGSYDPELKKKAEELLEDAFEDETSIEQSFTSRRYWITSVTYPEGKKFGVVFTYNAHVNQELLKNIIITIAVVTILVTLAITAIWTALAYTKYKVQYDTYAYRTMLTDMLAHDLKTPLTVISGYAENISENTDAEQNNYYSGKISENVDYMNNMISNILSMSEKEKLVIKDRKSIDIEAAINSLVKENEALLETKGLTVKVVGTAKAEVDEISFAILLRNIIDNAIKYAPEGDVIEISLSDKELICSNALAYEIQVENDKLFDAFVKGNKARTGRNGNGIGLAIVKSIADVHGFKCKILTEDNRFSIVLNM